MLTRRPLVVQVEGGIGVGKTTFLEQVLLPALRANGYDFYLMREPVDQWGEILELFYKNQERWAYTFETAALCSRISALQNVPTTTPILISERGISSQEIFGKLLLEQGHLTPLEYKFHCQMLAECRTRFPLSQPDLTIYVRTDLETSRQRIIKRNRKGEAHIPESYLKSLIEAHDERYLNDPRALIFEFSEELETPAVPVATLWYDLAPRLTPIHV